MTLPALLALSSLAAIAAIWLGYPLLVWVAARVYPARTTRSVHGAQPVVSVVLATREGASVVRARIENLLLSDYPAHQLEVIVALDTGGRALDTGGAVLDTGSAAHATGSAHDAGDAHDIEALRNIDARVRVVAGDAPGGKAAALNAGVRAATGDILVLADAHQRYDARTIPELVAALDDARMGAVSGALQLGGTGRGTPVDLYWTMEKWLRRNEARLHSTVGVTGAVYATRRALWPVVPVGTLLDDVYVPMALVLAGHRVGFTYAARAFDVRVFDAKNEAVRKTRTLTGVLQLRTLLPDIMSPRRNPIYLQFVAHKMLRLLTPVLVAMFALAAAVWMVQYTVVQATTSEKWLLAVGSAALLVLPATRRRIIALWRWVFALQLATTRALVNGLTGRWGVWSKTRT